MKHPHDFGGRNYNLTTLDKKVLIFFIIVIVDAVLTVYLITQGWSEANPILEWVMYQTNVSWMAITKIVISFLFLLMIYKKEETERPLNWAIPIYIILLVVGIGSQLIWEYAKL